MLLSVELATRW